MKKIIAFSILALTLCACGKHAESSKVKMENGGPGLLVHCNGLTEEQCVADVCKNGGQVVRRNVSNRNDTFLITCQ
jgi:uncharacterized membrane protein